MKSKAELRHEMIARRKCIPAQQRQCEQMDLYLRLSKKVIFDADDSSREGKVAVYQPTKYEFDVTLVFRMLKRFGWRLFTPCWQEMIKTYVMGEMSSETELVPGPRGILQPKEFVPVDPGAIDVWLVPGLAFTKDGKRLGYGGGWYDRLLAAARPDARIIGVGFSCQLVDELPVEAHDRRMTEVVIGNMKE